MEILLPKSSNVKLKDKNVLKSVHYLLNFYFEAELMCSLGILFSRYFL